MMEKEIVVDINPYQTRVILLEDSVPCEIFIEQRGKERLVGNIYKGRVQNVLPGMQAAFVDIGLEKNAFLYAGDIQLDNQEFVFGGKESLIKQLPTNIKDIVRSGQEILVQVFKEPVGVKGARITTHVTLPGHILVLMPGVDYVGVSRRICDETERERLKFLLEGIKPDGMGVIVRTAGKGKNEDEYTSELQFLLRLWDKIAKKSDITSAPRLVHAEEPLIFRILRDLLTPDVKRVVINDKEFFDRVQIIAGIISPVLRDRVVLYDGLPDIYDELGLERVIDMALMRKVQLKNGGYLIIDQTEALTTIDVNTGKFIGNSDNLQDTITAANCEAAKEIARQLRLRDISGIIIIDFIDMDETEDREKVVQTLKDALKNDRTRTNVLGMTQLGLVEMTRKKERQPISNTLQSQCPYCSGSGKVLSCETILLKIRKQIMNRFSLDSTENYLIRVHPKIAALIKENSTHDAPIFPKAKGQAIYVLADINRYISDFAIDAITESELKKFDKADKY